MRGAKSAHWPCDAVLQFLQNTSVYIIYLRLIISHMKSWRAVISPGEGCEGLGDKGDFFLPSHS